VQLGGAFLNLDAMKTKGYFERRGRKTLRSHGFEVCWGKIGILHATPANRAPEKWNHVVDPLSGYTSAEFAPFVVTIGSRTGPGFALCFHV
jgi:hypothetical protein